MINGRVVSRGEVGGQQILEPQISISIAAASSGVLRNVDCAIDTGFTAALIMPPNVIRALGLQYQGQRRLRFANGRQQRVRLFIGFIEWHGQVTRASVHEMNSKPLLGMGLLAGSRLTIENVSGGNVIIEELTTAS